MKVTFETEDPVEIDNLVNAAATMGALRELEMLLRQKTRYGELDEKEMAVAQSIRDYFYVILSDRGIEL